MELYECLNCFLTAALDIHGRCSRCGSPAVISLHNLDDEYMLHLRDIYQCAQAQGLEFSNVSR